MQSAKELHKYTQSLNVLYVEDDELLRTETAALLEPFFHLIVMADNGETGLEKYNNEKFDIVITDINMPKMNGIEMIRAIKEINPEQKIVAISAHNESGILIQLIKAGVNSFIIKPVILQEMIATLYPVSRDAYMQNLNIELVHELNEERAVLEQQLRELQMQSNTISTKHQQVEMLLQNKKKSDPPVAEHYFAADEDEGDENVLLLSDHCDDLTEIFNELPEHISYCSLQQSPEATAKVADQLHKAANILFHYTPYIDSLSSSMNDLAAVIEKNPEAFLSLLNESGDSIIILFDAVSSDMERYVERFSTESLAMRNVHHIHEPTALSVRQIIGMISPEEIEDGELEFF